MMETTQQYMETTRRKQQAATWRSRTDTQAAQAETELSQTELMIKELHTIALADIEAKIQAFYGRYADREGISMAMAKKRVEQMNVLAFSKKVKELMKLPTLSKEAEELLRLYNARMRINRLELLKAEIGLELLKTYQEEEDRLTQCLNDAYINETKRQAGILGDVGDVSGRIASAVNAEFYNATYRERIWAGELATRSRIWPAVVNGIIRGASYQDVARDIRRTMDVTTKESMRLARTEMVRVQTQAQYDSIKANGWEWFEFKAYGSRSCEECKHLDGKRFKVDEFTPGENAPPLHPKCRCRILPWEDEESESLLNALRGEKELDDVGSRGIIDVPAMFAKKQDEREGFRFISDKRFDELTIEARKEGAIIIRGTDEVEEHLEKEGAAAATLDDVILFRKDVCVSEVLEETRHFKQNKEKLNNDKGEPLRSILNEIEAKEYVLQNAKKYGVPRKEVEQLEKQVKSYKAQLNKELERRK